MAPSVSLERFRSGMTFDEYVAYIGTPQNLAREGSGGAPRRDFSAYFRQAYEQRRLTPAQTAALQWIAAQPDAPKRVLVISEDWSSDCRRDVPTLARIAEVLGAEMRIFCRDGKRFSEAHVPSLEEAPDSNADLMAQFLNHKKGQTWQSIPVAAFFTEDMRYLYHYTEYPAIYDKDRLVMERIRAPRPGETPEQTQERSNREFQALLDSPFFEIWTSAAVDEIASALHRRMVLGGAR